MLRLVKFEVNYRKFADAADSGYVSVEKLTLDQNQTWLKNDDPGSKELRETIENLLQKHGKGFFQMWGKIKAGENKYVEFYIESDRDGLRIYAGQEASERLEVLLK